MLVDLESFSLCGMFSLSAAAVLPLVFLPVLVLLLVMAGVWLLAGVGAEFRMLGEELSATPIAGGGGQSLDNIVENFSRYFRFCRPLTFCVAKEYLSMYYLLDEVLTFFTSLSRT